MTAMAFVSVGAVDITDPKYIWDGNIEDFKAYNDTKTIYIYTPGTLKTDTTVTTIGPST